MKMKLLNFGAVISSSEGVEDKQEEVFLTSCSVILNIDDKDEDRLDDDEDEEEEDDGEDEREVVEL